MRAEVASRQGEEDRHRMATTLLEEWSPAQDDLMKRLVAMAPPSNEGTRERVPPASAGGRRNR
jgi:hypothetical protein